MPVTTKTIPRIFRFDGTRLADPAPSCKPEQCVEILAHTYPKLNNAMLESPVIENGEQVYNLKVVAGTKG